jgi:hypothetical protein
MALQFTIIDQFGNYNIIDEPVGWDGINLHYVRHKDWHGFIDAVDDTMGSLQFYGDGYTLLSTAFASYGVEAQCGFIVEYQCSDTDTFWDTVYQGQFSFYKYKEVQGMNGCYVECSVESITNVMVLKNRYEQKVDLNSLVPFQLPASQYNYGTGSAPDPIQVVSMTITIPPDPSLVTVNNGDTYIVTNPINLWGGVPNDLATFDSSSGAFNYFTPPTGQVIVDLSTQSGYIYNGSAWVPYTADLAKYDALGGLITLPPKPIPLSTDSGVIALITPIVNDGDDTTEAPFHFSNSGSTDTSHSFTIGFQVGSVGDVTDFSAISDSWNNVNLYATGNNNNIGNQASPVLSYNPTSNYTGSTLNIKINVDFDIYAEVNNGIDVDNNPLYKYKAAQQVNVTYMSAIICQGRSGYQSAMQNLPLLPGTTRSIPYRKFTYIENTETNPSSTIKFTGNNTGAVDGSSNPITFSFQYDSSVDGPTINITPGDNIYIAFQLQLDGGSSNQCCVVPNYLTSYCNLSVVTGFQPTLSPIYMINESLSRVSEAITTDQIRVYSDFFGRTDSMPYATAIDGEGSLLGITNGLLVRGQSLQDGSLPPMPVSLKQLFEALSAIYNIGMTIEPDTDPARQGMYRLRVEPMEHFYPVANITDTTLPTGPGPMILDNVDEISTELQDEKYVGVFRNGYSKWQGEQTGGLEDFMNRREYRTSLSCAKNALEKYCDFIGSSYAIETTRRQSGTDTQDWRFDHETFVICTERPTPTIRMTYDPSSFVVTTDGHNNYTLTFTIQIGGAGYSSPPEYILKDNASSPNTIGVGLIPLDTVTFGDITTVMPPGGAAVGTIVTKVFSPGFAATGPLSAFTLTIPAAEILSAGSGPTTTTVYIAGPDNHISSITVPMGGTGSGYTIPPIVQIEAPPAGAGSSPATAIALLGEGGVVMGITVTSPGSGYSTTSPPTVNLVAPLLQPFQVDQFSILDTSIANIESPTTVYNYRISPARNAMRWLKNIFQSYADWINGVLYFVSGEANIIAQGQYVGVTENPPYVTTAGTYIVHPMENVPIAENQDLSYNVFDPSLKINYYPLYKNQLVKFTYPLSYAQWKDITANPYGLLTYNVNSGPMQYGWIEELKYSPFSGTADFVIKPQIS